MGVRVVHEHLTSAPPDSDYVHVRTCPDPNDDTITLATIQRITEMLAQSERSKPAQRVKTLVEEQPMSPDTAVVLAKCYAERKQIPVVYAETDDTQAEDTQTDNTRADESH